MQIKVADQVWLATALLTRENPDRPSFRVREIVDRADAERFSERLQPGVMMHASQHAVANLPANPGRYRMLYATPDRGRRLFRPGDTTHPSREGGKMLPKAEEIPQSYWGLLDWYTAEYSQPLSTRPAARAATAESSPELNLPTMDLALSASETATGDTVIRIPSFADAVDRVRRACLASGYLTYENPEDSFCEIVRERLGRSNEQDRYGVYLVRRTDSQEVLYIGMAGSIGRNGDFRRQDLLGRLTNVRGDISADAHFQLLLESIRGTGAALVVEYFAFGARPNSPALIEAFLLQAFLNELGRLPQSNNVL